MKITRIACLLFVSSLIACELMPTDPIPQGTEGLWKLDVYQFIELADNWETRKEDKVYLDITAGKITAYDNFAVEQSSPVAMIEKVFAEKEDVLEQNQYGAKIELDTLRNRLNLDLWTTTTTWHWAFVRTDSIPSTCQVLKTVQR